ncbi:cytochrome P450 [Coniophora puteana RWD-64-598 SS2]|uniref:Cytochrome P450 n=1 Tax=Coniophora puteana (strain RWD-64-598) TaxID=741705 RepID=A0A5M3MYY0_CONPW|nr:cytochrome P450 [Coniophora puteana RWD-64-598 SS2]EIW84358.1 cytochrome P450 [Coniophora puteana RWD-64-598 SS2]
MALSLSLLQIIPLGLLSWVLARYAVTKLRGNRSLPLPPGPKQLPFLGAVFDIDSESPWLTYTQWAAKYGDIISCRFFGSQVVVLNSDKAAEDLLDRRSRIYSDRPEISTVRLSGWDLDIGFQPYGNEWRLYRRLYQQSFREQKIIDYQSIQLAAAHRLLTNMSNNSDDKLWGLISLCTSSAILSTVYGYEVNALDDPLFHISDKATETGFPLLTPEMSIIMDTFPFVKYLPTWFPGTSIVREIQIAKYWSKLFFDYPYNFTMEKMQSNPAFSCVLSETIRSSEESGQSMPVRYLKKFAGTAFIAGAETAASVLHTLVVALLQNPVVQKRAQDDIQAVIGNDRLPTFEDRPSLPYIEAMVREALRWNTVLPLGVPHFSTEDDVYEGYFIPKGSTVLSNAWGMSRDPQRYPDPETFRPERFLTKDGELNGDDVRFTFGWGRRICPGRYSAVSAVWIDVASMLAAYTLKKAKDENGVEIEPIPEWTTGVARKPKPIPLRIVPRFEPSRLEQMLKEAQHD